MATSAYYEYKETLLRVENVNLNLGGRPILRDVNLELKNIHRPGMSQGQVVGLLGPSGMGKTQLFRILSGLNVPDSGAVFLSDGKPVKQGQVGVIAQSYPLLGHRTIEGNLMVAAKQAGINPSEAGGRIKSILERFHIADQGAKYPVQLSGGQRQRVAIAQQFLCSDDLLLMDEPFSGLDPIALDAICDFIAEIAQTNETKSYVVVTHDIESAVRVCDTLWLLGRERDASGAPIPGANIRHTLNLIEEGLAWRKGIDATPEFHRMVVRVKELFHTL